MGLEFSECDRCGETVCDADPGLSCKDCKQQICPDCQNELEVEGMNGWQMLKEECPFCKLETVTNTMIMDFLLEMEGVTREEAIEDLIKHRGLRS
jgi:hypothetical protein